MSESIYHIHYSLGFKIGKLDGLSRHSRKNISELAAYFFDKEQLLDLENKKVREEEDTEDMELEGINMATWEMKNAV